MAVRTSVPRPSALSHVKVPLEDEATLVARIRADDAGAFEVVFREYYRTLYEFAFGYVKERTEAEEIAQVVLCAIWERRATWELRGRLRSYLLTATRNAALNALRSARLRRPHDLARTESADEDAMVLVAEREDQAIPGMGLRGAGVEQVLVAEEWAHALRRAVASEPPRRRSILSLRWEHGLPYSEIAGVLGISVRAVEQGHLRAMRSLREKLASFRT